jgi:glycolate oxidase FAD binding subunit
LIFGVDAMRAIAALAEALNSPYEVSGAAHLPEAIARRSAVDYVRAAAATVTAIRVEGTAVSVAARSESLRKLLAPYGAIEELHSMNSRRLWLEVRDVVALLPDPHAAIWRVSLPASEGPRVAASVTGAECYFDWGGGLLWLAARAEGDAGAARLRAAIASSGGHATLLRGPEPLRAAIDVFEPQRGALDALTARIKDAFDPRRILNPGRMYAGV